MLPFIRLILASVFALAGATKLLDLRGSRRSLQDFGVPEGLIPALAIALPVAELVTAAALLPGATALYGAIAAVVLLAGFTGAISLSLLRGQRPDCHCFGQLHSQPVGWQVLARNAALLSMAVFVILSGWPGAGAGVGDWFLSLAPAWRGVVGGVAIGGAAYATRAVLRAKAISDAPLVADWNLMSVPVGDPAPEFSLESLDGGIVTLSMLREAGKPVVLIFTDPHCGSCTELLPDVARWQRELSANLTVTLVSRGTPEANRAKLGALEINGVLLQKDREVSSALGVPFTPGVILIGADGTVGSRPAPGDAAVRKMIAELVESPKTVMSAKHELGTTAPEFSLQDIEERPVTLAQLRGQATLLLFWDPGCTFCQQLLGHVRFWEGRPLTERPRLLVISKGEATANASQGFNATIVLDQTFAVGLQYGAKGTPSAVLVDAEGRIASEVAVGGSAILGLIGQEDLSLLSSGTSHAHGLDETAPAFTTLPPGAMPLQQDCVHDEMLADGSMVLYNGCRQQVLTLNPTAALVWEYCDGAHTVEAIVQEIAEVFPAGPSPEVDVRAMLDSFLQTGLIVAPTGHSVSASSSG